MAADVNSAGDGKDKAVWMVLEVSGAGRYDERPREKALGSVYSVGGERT
jgi:hypothetical protein